jgi:hypothetical protein
MEWGPVFWKVLHGLAWKAGSAPLPGLQGDEIRAWRNLLSNLPKTIPCEECRQHLTNYIIANPIVVPDTYSSLKSYVSNWLYELHESVNARLGKQPYLFEELNKDYANVPLRQTYEVLQVLVKRSVQCSAVSLLSWTNWSKYVKILFGMYN